MPQSHKRKINLAINQGTDKKGPRILPILKDIPHKMLPAGKSSFGSKSVMKDIPNENREPTNKPPSANVANKAMTYSSKRAAAKKATTPPDTTVMMTFFLPILSLRIPSGICEKRLAAAKHGMIKERMLTSWPILIPYTGKIPCNVASRNP